MKRQACYYKSIVATVLLLGFGCVELVTAGVFLFRLKRAFIWSKVHDYTEASLRELPSVSVCIPARNEMHSLSECLEAVLASDYRKLEVIVFDDNSGDDTSIIVRSFAHAGVRFVPGTELPDGWLGKNHALEVLAKEASGAYALFLDVDTRIQPTTISRLMEHITVEDLVMLSVIPQRSDMLRASVLLSPLRYFWQLVLYSKGSPATSSSLWMIRRELFLDSMGGFVPHKDEVEPEAHIAALLANKYDCIVSDATLGVGYEKKWTSQLETSRRVLYPMAGGKPWRGILALAILLFLNVPFFVFIAALLLHSTSTSIVALVIELVFIVLYGVYTFRVWRTVWWLGAILWPVIVMQEMLLFAFSMLGYMRGTVTWKGRLITAKGTRADSIKIDM